VVGLVKFDPLAFANQYGEGDRQNATTQAILGRRLDDSVEPRFGLFGGQFAHIGCTPLTPRVGLNMGGNSAGRSAPIRDEIWDGPCVNPVSLFPPCVGEYFPPNPQSLVSIYKSIRDDHPVQKPLMISPVKMALEGHRIIILNTTLVSPAQCACRFTNPTTRTWSQGFLSIVQAFITLME